MTQTSFTYSGESGDGGTFAAGFTYQVDSAALTLVDSESYQRSDRAADSFAPEC